MEVAEGLLRGAARAGDSEAQHALGQFYFFGIWVDRNARQAFTWFRKAAEQGHAGAQDFMGKAYSLSLGFSRDCGVTPNDSEAVEWFRKAAKQGHPAARYDLARQLWRGEGTVKDAAEAARLWRQLAEEGHAPSQSMLGRCYATGEGVTKNLDEAKVWLQRAVDQGYPHADQMLANAVAGRQPLANRGCLLSLMLPFTLVGATWLIYWFTS
jgi:hypothetical protein